MNGAIRSDDSDLVLELVEARASLEERDQAGRTPLHWACALGKADVVELLVVERVSLNQRDNAGDTPLQHACKVNLPRAPWRCERATRLLHQ